MVEFTFSPDEILEWSRLASREADRRPKRVWDRNRETIILEGIAADMAVARYFGVTVDLGKYRRGDKNEVDVALEDGTTVQTKFMHYRNGRLLFTKSEDFIADYAILVRGPKLVPSDRVWVNLQLVGGVDRETFFRSAHQFNTGKGRARLAMHDYELTPMRSLVARAA